MSRKTSIIYLCIAPALFLLSWYISHTMFNEFMKNGVGNQAYHGKERSLTYATVLTSIYVVAFFVIKDLYRKKK